MASQSSRTEASRSRSVQRRWKALDSQGAITEEWSAEPNRLKSTYRTSIFGGSRILEDTLLREMIKSHLGTTS